MLGGRCGHKKLQRGLEEQGVFAQCGKPSRARCGLGRRGMRLGALAWGAAALALGSRRLGVVVSGTGLCGGMGKAPHSGRDLVRCHHNQGTEKQGWIREFFCKNK